MRTLMIALSLTAGVTATMASAQDAPPPPHGAGHRPGAMGMAGLMQADANHDGVVTREEAAAASDATFDRLDVNRDGVLSPDELRAGRPMRSGAATPPPPAATPTPPPAPGAAPQGLTRDQWRMRAQRSFDRIDANHDGRVDQTELATYREMRRERRAEKADGAPPPPPPPATPGGQ